MSQFHTFKDTSIKGLAQKIYKYMKQNKYDSYIIGGYSKKGKKFTTSLEFYNQVNPEYDDLRLDVFSDFIEQDLKKKFNTK